MEQPRFLRLPPIYPSSSHLAPLFLDWSRCFHLSLLSLLIVFLFVSYFESHHPAVKTPKDPVTSSLNWLSFPRFIFRSACHPKRRKKTKHHWNKRQKTNLYWIGSDNLLFYTLKANNKLLRIMTFFFLSSLYFVPKQSDALARPIPLWSSQSNQESSKKNKPIKWQK